MSRKHKVMAAGAGGDRAAVSDQPVSAEMTAELTEAQIAVRAFSYWEERGCQGGSSEDDWFRAVDELTRERQQ
jgi:hypothetical protein